MCFVSFSCFIVMLAVANRSPRFEKRELIFLLLLTYVFFCNEGFPLPLGAWDGLCYFILTLPWPSI